jgi:hypothetical protein
MMIQIELYFFVYLNLALNYIGLPSLHTRLLQYAAVTLVYLNLLYLKVKKGKAIPVIGCGGP